VDGPRAKDDEVNLSWENFFLSLFLISNVCSSTTSGFGIGGTSAVGASPFS